MLVPAGMRRHVAAIYAFARAADDFADEGSLAPSARLALLDGWSARLRAAAAGVPPLPATAGEPDNTAEIFVALGATLREKKLPVDLFEDLLSAFQQDVVVTRYETWDDLLDYCRRSANPVGRLVLRVAGYRDPALDRWSDATCTALQLANFWQDLGVDYARGRIYLPTEIQRRHGAPTGDLSAGMTRAWRAALADVTARTSDLFDAGRPVCDAVGGRLRHELRATWLGGTRILDRLRQASFDPLEHRPRLGAVDAPWFAWRLLTWHATAGPAPRRPQP